MKQKKENILLIGPYPPPFGGISVQITRIAKFLNQSHSYKCKVLNIGKRRTDMIKGAIPVTGYIDFIYKLLFYSIKRYTFHIITSGHNVKSWMSAFACSLFGVLSRKRAVLAIGSGLIPEYIDKAGFFLKLFVKITLHLSGGIICRNNLTRTSISSLGISEDKLYLISGFSGVDPSLTGELPIDVIQFMNNRTPVIGAHVTADPEYGLYLVLKAFKGLKARFPFLGLILIGVSLQEIEETNHLHGLHDICKDIICTGSIEHNAALRVIKSLNIFIRATYFDGDSNSVREGLSLGVPVVASNTDFRPKGVILFKKGSVNDLISKITETLSLKKTGTCSNSNNDYETMNSKNDYETMMNMNKIIAIYDKLA